MKCYNFSKEYDARFVEILKKTPKNEFKKINLKCKRCL